MKVLQTVKYYAPSKGGMESVVENIINEIILQSSNYNFTVYSNSHVPLFRKQQTQIAQLNSIKEATPLILKSQPLNLRYASLKVLIKETDIVHHHYPFPNMELALLRNKALLKNKKLIITWHANIKNSRWSWIGRYYTPIIQKLLNIAEYIVVTSPQLLESSDILKDYVHKIKVIPLSFDPTLAGGNAVARTYPLNRKFRLLFVGKLRAYKGINYLIDAIKDLDVELYIVGDGECAVSLGNQVNELGLQKKVFFESGITNAALVDLYKKCDLFVLPSINEAEAFGVVQLEAMANGLPVINTDLDSGVPFVSLHQVTGLTVKPEDVVALSDAVTTVINDAQLYQDFSKNCIDRSKLFTRQKMAEAYLNLYN